MYHRHSAGAISYAELRHLGKEGVLGKYPVHLHLAGDRPKATAGNKPGGKLAAMPAKALGPSKTLSPVSGRLDAAMSRVDLTVLKRAVYGIYKLEGDELTLCLGVTQPSPVYDTEAKPDASSRPAAISPEAGTVVVLRRVKE